MTAEQAIEESIMHDQIITIETETPEAIETLQRLSDDWVDNGPVIEFWGRDEEGDEWRVHVAKHNSRRDPSRDEYEY